MARRSTGSNELEYIDGEVWANVWYTDTIVRIDPATGKVLGKLDLSGLHEQRSAGRCPERHRVGCGGAAPVRDRQTLVRAVRSRGDEPAE